MTASGQQVPAPKSRNDPGLQACRWHLAASAGRSGSRKLRSRQRQQQHDPRRQKLPAVHWCSRQRPPAAAAHPSGAAAQGVQPVAQQRAAVRWRNERPGLPARAHAAPGRQMPAAPWQRCGRRQRERARQHRQATCFFRPRFPAVLASAFRRPWKNPAPALRQMPGLRRGERAPAG
ncbi:hypothetical protein D3C87_1487300 [compost metagenome]